MLKIDLDWVEAEKVRGPELRATWARLEIEVAGVTITRVEDRRAQTTRNYLNLPLYPLAEWIVLNWWRLFYEPEPSIPHQAFRLRHGLVGAREGYALPSVEIQSFGEQVRFRWRRDRLGPYPVEFLEEGEMLLPRDQVMDELGRFVATVVNRLGQLGVVETVLEREWELVSRTDSDERAFCVAAASLGLDPYEVDDISQAAIVRAGQRLPVALHHEFFLVTDLGRIEGDAEEILEAARRAGAHPNDLLRIKDIRGKVEAELPGSSTPWAVGYEVAHHLRHLLGLGSQSLSGGSDLETVFGIDRQGVVTSNGLSNPDLDVVINTNESSSPGFVLRRASERSRRFHLCRALFEYLTSPVPEAALVTDSSSERQRQSRAFAAEFLAPAAGLKENLAPGRYIGTDDIEELSEQFGVHSLVVQHQIENHALGVVRPDF